MIGKFLGISVIALVFLRFAYELYRLIFDINGVKEDYRKKIEQLPEGSIGRISYSYLIESRYGIWIFRIAMAFGAAILALSLVQMLLR